MTALVDQFYADVQAAGGNRWDTSSLIKRLRYAAGLVARPPAVSGALAGAGDGRGARRLGGGLRRVFASSASVR